MHSSFFIVQFQVLVFEIRAKYIEGVLIVFPVFQKWITVVIIAEIIETASLGTKLILLMNFVVFPVVDLLQKRELDVLFQITFVRFFDGFIFVPKRCKQFGLLL